MQPHLTHAAATTGWLSPQVAIFSPINPSLNPHLDHAVFETREPILKNLGDLNAVHVDCIPNNTNYNEFITVYINSLSIEVEFTLPFEKVNLVQLNLNLLYFL